MKALIEGYLAPLAISKSFWAISIFWSAIFICGWVSIALAAISSGSLNKMEFSGRSNSGVATSNSVKFSKV